MAVKADESTPFSGEPHKIMSFFDQILPKKETKEFFLTLSVDQHRVIAVIAQISNAKVEIKGVGESEFGKDSNETEAADIAISTAEKDLSSEILVEKTVFAIKVNHLEKDKIKSDYLDRLKKISQELNLKPQGFIEYPEALAFHFTQEDGSPPTALFLNVERDHLIFFLMRVGKLQQSVILPRSTSLTADFEDALPKLEGEILPSRIILFDHEQRLEEFKEELLRFAWHKHSSFLHTPKIEILSQTVLLTSLVDAAGSSFVKKFHPETETLEQKGRQEVSEHERTETLPITPNEPREAFGFTRGKKIKEAEEKTVLPTKPADSVETFSPEKFSLSKFSQFVSKLALPQLRFLPFLILGGLAFLAVSSTTFIYRYYPKASVSLIVYPLVTSQQTEIILSAKAADGTSGKNIIPAKILNEEISGTKTAATTGKTNVGEKAKGEVTLYNKTLTTKTFPKGTVIINKELPFTLESDVTVASASDTGEGLSFGKITVKVTAVNIGPEGNLAVGNSFLFKDFPENSYSAKNNQAFSGGTSREVASVSAQDASKLENALTEELFSLVKQRLSAKLTPEEKLIDALINSEIVSKKLSPGIDSEAKEAVLSLTLKIQTFSFKESDLSQVTQQLVNSAPTGFTRSVNQTSVRIETASIDKNGNIKAQGKISAYFLPELDLESIKDNLTGKSYSDVSAYLSGIQYLGGVKILREASLPFWGNKLPFVKENIHLRTVSYLP